MIAQAAIESEAEIAFRTFESEFYAFSVSFVESVPGTPQRLEREGVFLPRPGPTPACIRETHGRGSKRFPPIDRR